MTTQRMCPKRCIRCCIIYIQPYTVVQTVQTLWWVSETDSHFIPMSHNSLRIGFVLKFQAFTINWYKSGTEHTILCISIPKNMRSVGESLKKTYIIRCIELKSTCISEIISKFAFKMNNYERYC